MKEFLKNKVIILILAIIFIIGSYLIYQNEEKKFKKSISLKLNEQTYIIKEYFDIAKSLVYSLKNTLENNLLIFEHSKIEHPKFSNMKYFKQKNSFNIQYTLDKNKEIPSSLFGTGDTKQIDDEYKKELTSVLFLSPIFKTALNTLMDVQWIYYTSKRGFMYLAPTNLMPTETFIKKQYEKNFWTEAIPKNNPNFDFIMTNLYIDGAGKGLMTTLSLPVINEKNFLGVVSLDIGLKTLNSMVKNHTQNGDIYLVNHTNHIIASTTSFETKERLTIENEKLSSSTIQISNVLKDKIRLYHVIKDKEKVNIILRNSISKILLLLFILSIIYMTYYLITLVTKIEELANKDFLTSLLNRRSMRKQSKMLINIAKRYEQNISFLLLDIDNFKNINDTFGHNIGDIALKEVSSILTKNSREVDLVSRYGGEEFLLCLTNTKLQEAYKLAERIRKDVNTIKIKDLDLNVSVSIGCIEFHKDENLDQAINRADKLLYQAKEAGKNQTQT